MRPCFIWSKPRPVHEISLATEPVLYFPDDPVTLLPFAIIFEKRHTMPSFYQSGTQYPPKYGVPAPQLNKI